MMRLTLGVLGGMGVQATGYFYDLLMGMQKVSKEQDYIDAIIYSKPSIPDRTAFITGQSDDSPLEALLHGVRLLESVGVSAIAVPCVTSHYFYDDIAQAVSVPVFNMLDETVSHTLGLGHTKVAILGTDGTLRGGVLRNAFTAQGIEVIEPEPSEQANVMDVIYKVKCGAQVDSLSLENLTKNLCNRGAQGVILGCTELTLAAKGHRHKYIDAMEVLATAILKEFGEL